MAAQGLRGLARHPAILLHVRNVSVATEASSDWGSADPQLAELAQQRQEGLLIEDSPIGSLALKGDDARHGGARHGRRQACVAGGKGGQCAFAWLQRARRQGRELWRRREGAG